MAEYCTDEDLVSYGIRAEALRGIDPEELQRKRVAASAKIDSYLRARYKLPLLRWGTDLSETCAKLTVYMALMGRGFNAARPGDELIRTNYEDAIKTLEGIQAQRIHPDVTDSSDATEVGQSGAGARPDVISSVSRGYSDEGSGYGGAFVGRSR